MNNKSAPEYIDHHYQLYYEIYGSLLISAKGGQYVRRFQLSAVKRNFQEQLSDMNSIIENINHKNPSKTYKIGKSDRF